MICSPTAAIRLGLALILIGGPLSHIEGASARGDALKTVESDAPVQIAQRALVNDQEKRFFAVPRNNLWIDVPGVPLASNIPTHWSAVRARHLQEGWPHERTIASACLRAGNRMTVVYYRHNPFDDTSKAAKLAVVRRLERTDGLLVPLTTKWRNGPLTYSRPTAYGGAVDASAWFFRPSDIIQIKALAATRSEALALLRTSLSHLRYQDRVLDAPPIEASAVSAKLLKDTCESSPKALQSN